MHTLSTATQLHSTYTTTESTVDDKPVVLLDLKFNGEHGSTNFVDSTTRHNPIIRPNTYGINDAKIVTGTSASGNSCFYPGLVNHGVNGDYMIPGSVSGNGSGGGIIVDADGSSDWAFGTGPYNICLSINIFNNKVSIPILDFVNGNQHYITVYQQYISPNNSLRGGYIQFTAPSPIANASIMQVNPGEWTKFQIKTVGLSTKIYRNDLFQIAATYYVATMPNIQANQLYIGAGKTFPFYCLDGYLDDIKVSKPVVLLELRFDDASDTDYKGRHQFITEGTPTYELGFGLTGYYGPYRLASDTGNLKSISTTNDFSFDDDFNIMAILIRINTSTGGTIWKIYDNQDNVVLGLEYTATSLTLIGPGNTTLATVLCSLPTGSPHTVDVVRINGYLKLHLNANFYDDELVHMAYPDIIDGDYIRIGGEGSGNLAKIQGFLVSKG